MPDPVLGVAGDNSIEHNGVKSLARWNYVLGGGWEHTTNKPGIKYLLYQRVMNMQNYQAGKGNR